MSSVRVTHNQIVFSTRSENNIFKKVWEKSKSRSRIPVQKAAKSLKFIQMPLKNFQQTSQLNFKNAFLMI